MGFVLLLDTACAASNSAFISEIKANTQRTVRKPVKHSGRTVDNDTDIEVAYVSQFPVIRITLCEPADARLPAGYA